MGIMIDEELEKKIEAVGWTIMCYSPMEMAHEDGGEARGNFACEAVINSALKDYKEMREEEEVEAEKVEEASATASLNLESINGYEIIDFLNQAIQDDEELCDVSIVEFKFEGQEINKKGYSLNFTGVFNNWSTYQDYPGQKLLINKDGINFNLYDPFDGDGSDYMLEIALRDWIKTHKFSTDYKDKFDGVIDRAFKKIGLLGFKDKDKLDEVIKLLNDAKTYMK